jgi:D-glycero-alpha-D-manno-heptose 1-phosphate guanylyltransferase
MSKTTEHSKESGHNAQVVILAGGLGKRLRSVFSDGPKSLAPVQGRPFLDYLLRWVQLAGFNDIVLCVGYKRGQIRKRYARGEEWGLKLSYSVERCPLGTGGAIKLALRQIHTENFVVLNGDSFVDVDFSELLRFHRSRCALATITLAEAPPGGRYGHVRVRRAGDVLEFVEKGSTAPARRKMEPNWINAGVYVFRRELLPLIPSGLPVSLERDVFPKLVGRQFYGYRVKGYFIDIGVPKDYEKAQSEFPKRFRI